jgi:hypothetical protein
MFIKYTNRIMVVSLTYTGNKYLSLGLSPLIADVLSVACFSVFVGVPLVVGFPAVDGGFAVDSFPANPGTHMLL